MSFSDDIDNISNAGSIDSNLTELDFDEVIKTIKNTEYLTNVDYSLNSPLISDEIDEFIKFIQGKPYRASWNKKIWDGRKRMITKLGVNTNLIKKSDSFHTWFGSKNLITKCNLTNIEILLKIAQNDSDQTFPIIRSFFLSWLNREVNNPDKSNCDNSIKKWGAYFLDFHLITLLLNAQSISEKKSLSAVKNVDLIFSDSDTYFIYNSLNFGKVAVSDGFAVFLNDKLIMDRNMVLMCKDTYAARFQTLFCMVNRSDDKFDYNDWQTVNKIYKEGDEILRDNGSTGYDSIKMIEPMCTLRIAELAREFRPLIPNFNNFGDHINESINDLERNNHRIRKIFNTISNIMNVEVALTVFGSFRHWGHPFIDYKVGLGKLNEQVNLKKDIDLDYADKLGSDMAFIILESKFKETKKWFVDKDQVPEDHALKKHITDNTWPTPKQIQDFGDNWNKLPLSQCFDIPDLIDPTLIYSDKSHSMDLDGVIKAIKENPNVPIPSKKVLQTFLERPETNWKEFLRMINDEGLPIKDLVIGLKGKERELKSIGRFFTLMSWKLREYFVSTEYLIKTHFVPLFKGLTMADDLNTVNKKILDNSIGQGNNNYENICIANHIDYQKWNNHQRYEANAPVFKVMGQFLGLPNLFNRTHQFFQQSLIYYNGRPDLLKVVNGQVQNKGPDMMCWQGQEGGLEGLRQKGWSVVNFLVIRRESINTNTKVKVLAQGDNQVICTQYKTQKTRDITELRDALQSIVDNNQRIMTAIEEGTRKLGLIINRDETMQSADFMIYGKVPIFRGNIRGLETKRWSRVTCVTNDQLPTLANTLSTVGSNALTVAHYSDSPLNPIIHYNFLGNFARVMLEFHNPALKDRISNKVKNPEGMKLPGYKSAVLYLDPSLGGACGLSLTRFLIRGFPDPVTEGLSFWRFIYDNLPLNLKNLAINAGNPKLGKQDLISFKKLLEDPLSLNIPGGVNPNTIIKEEIKRSLIENSYKLKNNIVKESLDYCSRNEERLFEFLRSIKPLFPRFLSEYLNGTYLGIIQGLIGLFQNSKTIRTMFTRKIDKRIIQIILESEIHTLNELINIGIRPSSGILWKCSSQKADELRQISWGEKVLGATIPHPIELIGPLHRVNNSCSKCDDFPPNCYYLSTLIPRGLKDYKVERGMYKAYLGSRTSESTSILLPWEKESKIPLIRRAAKLRSAIGWFIEKDSKLGRNVIQNLNSLTGEDWSVMTEGFKRTGSALHRFSCSRQSPAGYAAQSPSKLTWMCSTTDTMGSLNTENHDFMHQSLLIYVQITAGELHDHLHTQGYYHGHINCILCLRPIENPILDTNMEFTHPDVSGRLEKWKPNDSDWSEKKETWNIQEGRWDLLTPFEQSYHIGRAEGFIYGDLLLSGNSHSEDGSLFPLSIQKKIIPENYLEGILDGLIRSSSINCLSRRSISELIKPRETMLGVALHLIDSLCKNNCFLSICRCPAIEDLIMSTPIKIPASYPLSDSDLGSLCRYYLRDMMSKNYIKSNNIKTKTNVWIFSDINNTSTVGLLAISTKSMKILYKGNFNKNVKNQIRQLKEQIISYKDPKTPPISLGNRFRSVYRTDQEIRHASKFIYKTRGIQLKRRIKWGRELSVPCQSFQVEYISFGIKNTCNTDDLDIQRYQNPLISSMREFQFATGSHYKIMSIIDHFKINFNDFIAAGDGSGGIGSLLLRLNHKGRLIFNSLLDLSSVSLRGSTPSPPSAIFNLVEHRDRCINLNNAWENPSDLSNQGTWSYFKDLKVKRDLNINLMTMDMECQKDEISDLIEEHLSTYIFELLEPEGTLIYKTYVGRIINDESILLNKVGTQFKQVYICYTDITSSQSSEVYVVMKGQNKSNIPLKFDSNHLRKKLKEFPVFKDLESEFRRALKLKQYNMMQGIPKHYVSNKEIDLSILLSSLGLETGVSSIVSSMTSNNDSEINKELPYLIYILLINSLLKITSLSVSCPKAPTDSTVYNIGSATIGFLNWISISKNDIRPHKMSQDMINNYFPFSWTTYKITIKDKIYFKNRYSCKSKYKNTKNFHLDSNMAKIGQYTRIMIRCFGNTSGIPDMSKVDKGLKYFNKSLSIKTFIKSWDIFECTAEPISYSQGVDIQDVNEQIENYEIEGAYVS